MVKLKNILQELNTKSTNKTFTFYTALNNHIYAINAKSQKQASELARIFTEKDMKKRYDLKKPLNIPYYKWKLSKPFWEYKTKNIIKITYTKNSWKKKSQKHLAGNSNQLELLHNIND